MSDTIKSATSIGVAIAGLLYSASVALAGEPTTKSEPLAEALRSCAHEINDATRLQCYDRVAVNLEHVHALQWNTSHGSNKGPGRSAADSQSDSTTPQDIQEADADFGLTAGQVLRNKSNGQLPAQLKRLTSRIATLSRKTSGGLVIHLDNGQVWEQTEEGPDLPVVVGDEVTIDRGLLGAYWLSRQSSHVAIKVQRTH
jgi:hypothetical protein